MAEMLHPRLLNDVISTCSSGVSTEVGLLSPAGVVSSTTSLGRSPTPTDGYSEVGSFSEQVWGIPRERGQLRLVGSVDFSERLLGHLVALAVDEVKPGLGGGARPPTRRAVLASTLPRSRMNSLSEES
jgi:hypothetical protein